MVAKSSILSIFLGCCITGGSSLGVLSPKDYRKPPPEFPQRGGGEVLANKMASADEPSCEELRAMWRFSKRQSRAAEITNEIPTYRDPFTYNIWEPYYASTRSVGGLRAYRFRDYYRPVYGRVVHKAPLSRVRSDSPERARAFEEVARHYGAIRAQNPARRRLTNFRLPGGGVSPPGQNSVAPQTGSFQRLKELIRTERARELQEQRVAEEMAARAAALREMANGQRFTAQAQYNPDAPAIEYQEESDARAESPTGGSLEGVGSRHSSAMFSFPDLLAPAGAGPVQDAGYSQSHHDDYYSNVRPSYRYTDYGNRFRGEQE